MADRGRPPLTRARVLTYWRKHGPCPIMQIVRGTGADRSSVQRHLRTLEKSGRLTEDGVDRFWRNVDRRSPEECWNWLGAVAATGYPHGIVIAGKHLRASHVALDLDGRPRPSNDLSALHSCDNKLCVNPAHLRWGTDAENAEDHRQRGKRGAHWLPDETVHEIHRSEERNLDIALRLGLSPATVCNIRKGRYHRHIFEQYHRTAAE